MRSNCLYIGALGSKKTQAKRLERLRVAGFTDDELARIHAPALQSAPRGRQRSRSLSSPRS
jgi:xanthine/CO dehydrogenase XdhC/CoxF family maturation factor